MTPYITSLTLRRVRYGAAVHIGRHGGRKADNIYCRYQFRTGPYADEVARKVVAFLRPICEPPAQGQQALSALKATLRLFSK